MDRQTLCKPELRSAFIDRASNFAQHQIDQLPGRSNLPGFAIINGDAESIFNLHYDFDAVESHGVLLSNPRRSANAVLTAQLVPAVEEYKE